LSYAGRLIAIATTSAKYRRGLLIGFLAGLVMIHGLIWWRSHRELRAGYQDFAAFYTAGKLVSEGKGSQLYDDDLQYRTQLEFAPGVDIRQGPMRYIHPPLEAVVFVPFAKLPYFEAYLLWSFLNLIVLGLAVLVLRSHLPGLRAQPALWWLVGPGFFPAFLALIQGQDILPLLLLYALAWTAMKRHSDFTAGCWFGLGLFRFHLVLPFLFVLALRKRWRLLGGSAAMAMLMALLSVAVIGWKAALAYPAYSLHLANQVGTGVNTPEHMPNLRGLLYVLLPSGKSHLLLFAVVALSLVMLWVTAKVWRSSDEPGLFSLRFSLALIAALLVSYHGYDYDLSLALIPVLLSLDYLQTHSTPRSTQWLLLAPAFLLFLTPLHMVLLFQWRFACLLSIVLLFWFWAVAREILRASNHSSAHPNAVPESVTL
jgi:hypothetical protein